MIGALWTGISGLKTAQSAIDNESNNVANVNTIGYKASRVSFADMMYQDSIGKGSRVTNAEKQYTQGSMKGTESSYDLALYGDGFFVVRNVDSTGTSETLYTRAGNMRMGDNGTLQDANGYEVQGWAMSPVDPSSDIISTNNNWTSFNQFFTEIAGNQIVKFPSRVETYAAKMTDYAESARSDSTVLSGSGIKNYASKVSDIEALVTNYNDALSRYAENPEATSSPSQAQRSVIDFPDGASSSLNAEGEQIYVFINGDKYTQDYVQEIATPEFITAIVGPIADLDGDGTADAQGDYDVLASRAATYKAMADRISNITGLNAYTIDVSAANNPSTAFSDVINGRIMIESIIPGEEFVIGDIAESSDNIEIQGTTTTITESVQGTGQGAVDSAMRALRSAVAGNQYDVYQQSDVLTDDNGISVPWDGTNSVLTYTMSIDGTDYTITTTPGQSYDASIAELITSIETAAPHPEITDKVSAKLVNGELVIKSNTTGEEFTGIMRYDPTGTGTPVYRKEKNLELSGNTGAGAEFMQIISTVDQETSRTSLQLKLDSLGLTDESFGEISVDETGLVTMTQDGVDFVIGQIAIAQFSNNIGLESIGDNLLKETTKSGTAIYTINNDNSTTVNEKNLELSTADLSESLVNLMVFQRAFEANSKSITTSDELLTTLIQLKR
ncbi:flagellar hook-basal body complex protein [Halarcobacter sp.]|uniref:flagellar hook-basal body complex protein n=1 Tax=Halarcobacter sp. TaxID=2321133 RepID=UPI0029F558B2|nr:flagellar hook-basal body complex protein [Halarcobacter sp.]